MVCKHCGTENINATRFCVGCGAPIEEERPVQRPAAAPKKPAAQQPEVGYCGQPILPKKSKRPWIIAGAVVLALVLLIVILACSSGADDCEDVAEKFVIAYLMSDQETLEQVTETSLYQYLQMNVQMSKTIKECQAEAISSEKCTESEMDDLRELYSYLGAKGNFTNAHMVEVEYTVTTQSGESSTRVANVALSEINNAWYVVYIG